MYMLTASDTSKTAKNYKKVITPSAHRPNVNVLLSNVTFLLLQFFTFIFAVLLHF